MKIYIKKIITEDSELMKNVRNELTLGLQTSNVNGKRIEQLTKTVSPDDHIIPGNISVPKHGSELEESIVQTKRDFLSNIGEKVPSQAIRNLKAGGQLGILDGTKAVENSPINLLKHQSDNAAGLKYKPLNESVDPTFGHVSSNDKKILKPKTQAELDRNAIDKRAIDKKLQDGISKNNPSTLIHQPTPNPKAGMKALLNIQKSNLGIK